MLNQAFDQVVDHGWLPSFDGRGLHLSGRGELSEYRQDVPVLPATVLGLELLLQEPFIDLRMASELVLSDMGATIQILRLIGAEYGLTEERPSRIEDCIASLDVEDWFAVVSAQTLAREDGEAAEMWKHSRLIAQCARLVAEPLDSVCPEEAYLAGLLHEIGAIPAVLGWDKNEYLESSDAGLGARHKLGGDLLAGKVTPSRADLGPVLAKDWLLPSFVSDALRKSSNPRRCTSWWLILDAAHELANAEIADDSGRTVDFRTESATTN